MRVANSSLLLTLSLIFTLGSAQRMEAANIEQGRRLALVYCARCHAIDKVSPSDFGLRRHFVTYTSAIPSRRLRKPSLKGS